MTQTIGSAQPEDTGPYGDIRDVLTQLPHPPDAGTAYALLDLFTVRHEIIRNLQPAPKSVFEFGALYGFFLVTALDAAPSIERVGWVDNQTNDPNSNARCESNVLSMQTGGRSFDYLFGLTRQAPWLRSRQFDLVQVDSGHSYEDCLADLQVAARLKPRWIMVDDYTASTHRMDIAKAVGEFTAHEWLAERLWQQDVYETRNGLLLLTA